MAALDPREFAQPCGVGPLSRALMQGAGGGMTSLLAAFPLHTDEILQASALVRCSAVSNMPAHAILLGCVHPDGTDNYKMRPNRRDCYPSGEFVMTDSRATAQRAASATTGSGSSASPAATGKSRSRPEFPMA
jgi:hypothetical protein